MTEQKKTEKIIRQQCKSGLDASPTSFAHGPHPHFTKHGRKVWCRGWFPQITASKSLIDYFKAGTNGRNS
jgi:hypothetical protein